LKPASVFLIGLALLKFINMVTDELTLCLVEKGLEGDMGGDFGSH